MSRTRRSVIAFVVAPLWVPILVSSYLIAAIFSRPLDPIVSPYSIISFAAIVSIIVSYGGTVAIGLPIYWMALRWRRTRFAIAPVVGFAVGLVTWLVVVAIAFPHPVDELAKEVLVTLREPTQLMSVVWPGWIGALVGITLWLFARPDRP